MDDYFITGKDLIYIIPLDYFESLSLFLLSSLISFIDLPFRQKILKSTEEQELEKSLKMQQEVMEMRKKNEEFKKLALAGAGQLGSGWIWFIRGASHDLGGVFLESKAKKLSRSVVGIKRCAYLEGWTWVPFIFQRSFPRTFSIHWLFLEHAVPSVSDYRSYIHFLRPFSMRPSLISSSRINSSLLSPTNSLF